MADKPVDSKRHKQQGPDNTGDHPTDQRSSPHEGNGQDNDCHGEDAGNPAQQKTPTWLD
jgi:hypothetical protein